jgi:UV DNA damage repair endonuclease
MIRLGLCCIFRDQPIKFLTTTATAIGKMKRADALVKLSGLCMANADALLVALRFCADNGIGCFRINSQILPIKTHPTTVSVLSPRATAIATVFDMQFHSLPEAAKMLSMAALRRSASWRSLPR